ncbi:MAG: carbamoyl-phosphate synthase large subunit [Proteobacteria bacterium]|nr:carbamoyl-phosphate synthase large subunit [Pseudomonadota bacterium]
MPRRTDLQTILVLGAGPIVIGQAAEFDYSGTQAVKALKAEGYRVVLVNSNPATIMTDPSMADATYVEPLTPEVVESIIARERPDALLPTVGGQTALNLAVHLAESGVLERHGVRLIGASLEAMRLAEDRSRFQAAMEAAGLSMPQGEVARSLDEARAIAERIGRYPLLVRASFTLGGSGGGIVATPAELEAKVTWGLRESPTHEVLVEESVLGWKEYELEVMRDGAGTFVVICSIENFDPMGVHTGDSITVAPAMTLTDREYQRLRNQARRVMDAVGVETGGSNVQFAVDPRDGRVLVIEMNPRVSRSSALASKATGFPIAKIAALLAVGYRLDELRNDITNATVASFEPSIDYVVAKLPRWAFEKFKGVDPTLGPQMKSVGEAMAIGRTFRQAFLEGLQSLELSRPPFPSADHTVWDGRVESLATPRAERIWAIWEALRAGVSSSDIARVSGIDPWFLDQLTRVVDLEQRIEAAPALDRALLEEAKRNGFGDAHIAARRGMTAERVRALRAELEVRRTFHMVDTCAGEFSASTPYLYGAYESRSEAPPSSRQKVIILGSGPNRIGQGIEFDYCCVHAAQAVREAGHEAVMVNCNPETVSTDYDASDRLYFEPLTLEHVLDIVEREQPLLGVIAQFGGQTPLNLAAPLAQRGIPIIGTLPDAIDLAEDRGRFSALLTELEIPAPAFGMAGSLAQARTVAREVGYPVVVRPSYVLGGRAMAIIYDEEDLEEFVGHALAASPGQPVLIDQYLENAYEVDVDAVGDGDRVVIGGIMQHIEEAGIHSGDSACVLPPYKISLFHLTHIREYTERLGLALGVRGLMNVQYAIKDDVVYVLEVNPRASRTTPYVSKATGVPLARVAAHAALGRSLDAQGFMEEPTVRGFFVKEAVLPFRKFLGVDTLLGPEMRSTGEVMGHAPQFGHAYAKAELAAGDRLPLQGRVFVSVNDLDKSAALKLARDLHRLGFELCASRGTAAFFQRANLPVQALNKVSEGHPHVLDAMEAGEIGLIINTPAGSVANNDGQLIRTASVRCNIPLMSTLSAAQAAVSAVASLRANPFSVAPLQEVASEPPRRAPQT